MDIGTSYGLAFASGINAYLPLLSLAIAAHFFPGNFHVNSHFTFITQPWFMVVMGILTVADLVADKIPGVDHVWDTIHTIIRPVTGALVAAAAGNQAMDNNWLLPVTMAVGASIAGVTHTTKATTRLTSTATTAGCLNIGLSIAEDIVMALSILISFVAPYVMLIIVAIFILAFLIYAPKIVRRFRQWRRGRNRQAVATAPLQNNSSGHI
ncbi:hypothetical protein KDA_07420 [Dictyobacter alpinus]|uniref:DUF4126 domain-containing protein n=1 Tax=Dictyobacter alpinus TaxID=2014873 RepID=A0A402B1P9_9CHLR|nr:DUF4126 domain-containing protein [Dictyobacter alpinus]GCE25258.1 hypothetical protein KDA_07420 [Dictyobacter alpinus]